MPTQWTTESYVQKANEIHQNQYRYFNTVYKAYKKHLIVTCLIHGDFQVRPDHHLKGQGCKECFYTRKRRSQEEFIRIAQIIHNNFYTYEKSVYKNQYSYIIITCPLHGDFLQRPSKHLAGKRCLKCAGQYSPTTQEFIDQANLIHNFYYTYNNFVYINNITKGLITCPIHGDFLQSPGQHIRVQRGCPKCSKCARYELKSFVKKAIKVHKGKYTYEKTIIINATTKSIFTCPIHGDFLQTPHKHLRGQGCIKCISHISKPETQWLDLLEIPIKYRNKSIKYPDGKLYRPDAFVPETNTIYNFDGDFWHGNPLIFDSTEKHPICKKTYGELYEKTIYLQNILKNNNFSVVSIWENEFATIQKYLETASEEYKHKIIKAMKTLNGNDIIALIDNLNMAV